MMTEQTPFMASPEERARIAAEGMYHPEMEGDACGVGLVAATDGRPSRRVVVSAIDALKAVWHRGAVDAALKAAARAGENVMPPSIAAAKAGALEVVACDLDPLALQASRANAELNEVQLSYSSDFFAEDDRFDLILVADVLYDRANLPLLDQFLSRGRQALVADSRVRDFRHPLYRRLDVLEACTWPDLAEPAEFRLVSLYHAERGQA